MHCVPISGSRSCYGKQQPLSLIIGATKAAERDEAEEQVYDDVVYVEEEADEYDTETEFGAE